MADPYAPFGYAMPAIPGFNPRLPGYQTPNTMTGLEMGPPVARPPNPLAPAGGLVNPLGFGPVDPGGRVPGTVPTLTGQQLPLSQGSQYGPLAEMLQAARDDPAGAAVGGTLAMGPAFNMAGRIASSQPVQALGRTLAKPAVGVPAGVGAATYATTGQTADAPGGGLGQIDADIADVNKRRNAAQKTLEDLQAEERTFTGLGDLPSKTPAERAAREEAIRRAQTRLKSERLYNRTIDGNWGGETTSAVQRFLERNRAAQEAAKKSIEQIGGELPELNQRRKTAEMRQAEEEADRNTPWYRKAIRDYAGLAGMVAGPFVGPLTRRGVLRFTDRAEKTAAAEANALIDPTAPMSTRVSNQAEFFRRGGSQTSPFQVAPDAPMGFAPTPNQPSATALFPERNSWLRPQDAGVMAAWAGTSALGEFSKEQTAAKLKEAQDAFKLHPTPENGRRVAIWEAANAGAMAGTRMAEGALLTYPGAAAVPRMRYPSNRPNTAAAQAEMMELNAALRNRPLEAAEVAARRRDPNFSVPAGQPTAAGDARRMVSPKGQKMLIQQPDGTWADEAGRRGTPGANWRRISAVPFGFAPIG